MFIVNGKRLRALKRKKTQDNVTTKIFIPITKKLIVQQRTWSDSFLKKNYQISLCCAKLVQYNIIQKTKSGNIWELIKYWFWLIQIYNYWYRWKACWKFNYYRTSYVQLFLINSQIVKKKKHFMIVQSFDS